MAEIDWDALARVIDVFSSEEYTPILHQFYPSTRMYSQVSRSSRATGTRNAPL